MKVLKFSKNKDNRQVVVVKFINTYLTKNYFPNLRSLICVNTFLVYNGNSLFIIQW